MGLAYLVDLRLGGLLEGVQDNVQVLLELPANGKGDITKHRENLRLHRPMNVFILEEVSAPLQSVLYKRGGANETLACAVNPYPQ